MTAKILIVTPPDDTLLQGPRLLLVNLDDDQSSVVSAALLNWSRLDNVINYVWHQGQPMDWLWSAVVKSNLIIFNADHTSSDLINGYLAALNKSCYFGNLKHLQMVNDHVIFDSDQVTQLVHRIATKNEQN